MGTETEKWRDLGLTYEQAAHGMQTAVAFEIEQQRGDDPNTRSTSPKHLRVGINARAVDHAALAYILIRKGIITEAEYLEELRLAMNDELARYQDAHPPVTFR